MIPINLLINDPVIDTQNVHPLIDQIVHRTSPLRGTTVQLLISAENCPVKKDVYYVLSKWRRLDVK